jgi:L-ascorbate metabolism protein UlaG (beta-lactamase superfamily)
MNPESFVTDKIDWLGHASFRINGSKSTIYIDPWKLKKNSPPADVICITHSHFDHLSEEDVALIRKPSTVIIAPPDCKGSFGAAFSPIAPGGSVTVGDITVEAVPAYNVGKDFHPKTNNWVGYVITVDGVRVYHSGDTDLIPEMSSVKTDVALLPTGGTYTMTVKQAAEAVLKIGPKVAVPMHCGDIVGTLQDRQAFKAACKIPVVILDPKK